MNEHVETNQEPNSQPKTNAPLIPVIDNYGVTPLEDRHGRSLWIKTRQCFCSMESETDCRFHSPEEKGWEICPNSNTDNKILKNKGIWLWAHNPLYGKPLTDEEIAAIPVLEAA